MNKKHAYLIMAHSDWDLLVCLIHTLDDERNDIYLHIDRKCRNVNEDRLRSTVCKSKLTIIHEISVHWGNDSIMRCELVLLKAAVQEHYAYYHLLSGTDLPIKSQDDIHEFFDSNQGKEFVHFQCETVKKGTKLYNRAALFHWIKSRNLFTMGFDWLSCRLQMLLGVDRWAKQEKIMMVGANWFSITDSLARYVVSQEQWLLRTFSYSHCCDEIFLQTLVYNSAYRDRLYQCQYRDDYKSNVRYIDWTCEKNRRHPKILTMQDYESICQSDRCFARKFNEKVDNCIIQKIVSSYKDVRIVENVNKS